MTRAWVLASALLVVACAQESAPSPVPSPTPVARPARKPEDLFILMGCTSCHAEGAPHHDKLAAAKGKPVDEVATWILDARAKKPDTAMPTFSDRLTAEEARALAAWVQAR